MAAVCELPTVFSPFAQSLFALQTARPAWPVGYVDFCRAHDACRRSAPTLACPACGGPPTMNLADLLWHAFAQHGTGGRDEAVDRFIERALMSSLPPAPPPPNTEDDGSTLDYPASPVQVASDALRELSMAPRLGQVAPISAPRKVVVAGYHRWSDEARQVFVDRVHREIGLDVETTPSSEIKRLARQGRLDAIAADLSARFWPGREPIKPANLWHQWKRLRPQENVPPRRKMPIE